MGTELGEVDRFKHLWLTGIPLLARVDQYAGRLVWAVMCNPVGASGYGRQLSIISSADGKVSYRWSMMGAGCDRWIVGAARSPTLRARFVILMEGMMS
ncbi:hypothetical protein [Dactylosporangium salmoneum]|uniref:hypothetical protein n=1 Tax=Dactylosporangium salmoneum TaxID=53361 RepID=UPI0031DF519B